MDPGEKHGFYSEKDMTLSKVFEPLHNLNSKFENHLLTPTYVFKNKQRNRVCESFLLAFVLVFYVMHVFGNNPLLK